MNNGGKINSNMQVAYVFMIISCIIGAFFLLIPLAWLIPMTLSTKKLITDYRKATGLGVCQLLFTSIFGIVAGILVLTNNEKDYHAPTSPNQQNNQNTPNNQNNPQGFID
ncbi:hypothetical protein SHELI_v1c03490 [Spiroplasma helicoides]|uniref:Uncharacterized protein n=1 Tax=Spiroplasma helicoides TaxID=216938 RepID=A0A1B3SK46_9MOLU|nr:hypothetical protein [Spiroplasma helicoides]AOG60304.1 hypothetical protein SHELI_v1c03490 [Spiroplasma helicoides]